MSESNSNDLRWRTTGFLVALVVSVTIELTLSKIAKYEQDGYESYKSEYAVDLYSLFLKAKAECNKEKKASEENSCHETVDAVTKRHIDPRDLLAQETMALGTRGILHFTGWLAVISFLALAFTAVGIYLVWQSLEENRKTFRHIQRSAAAELRPYLDITISGLPQVQWVDNGRYHQLYFWATFSNKGATPARDFTGFEFISGSMSISRSKSKSEEFRIKTFGWPEFWEKKLAPSYIAPGQTADRPLAIEILANDMEKEGLFDLNNPNANIRSFSCSIKGVIRYKDEFTLANNTHHAITFMMIATKAQSKVKILGESTLPDEHHYDGYEKIKLLPEQADQ